MSLVAPTQWPISRLPTPAHIVGRQVQLPLDAYIKRIVCTGVCRSIRVPENPEIYDPTR